MKPSSYFAFGTTAFQARLAYRNQVWAGMFGDLVFIFARIAIWVSLYGGMSATAVDGVTLPQMITYALLAGPVLIWDYQRLFYDVGETVRSGDVAVYLLKPFHYPAYLLATHSGNFVFDLLTMTIPVVIIVALTFGLLPPASPFHASAFLAYWALSFAMLFALVTLLGLAAFWLMTTQSLEWFFSSIMTLLAGGVVPLWFFPDWLAAIAGHLPFAWVSFYPAAVFLGRLDHGQTVLYFVLGLAWLGVLLLGLVALWAKARHRLVVQGG